MLRSCEVVTKPGAPGSALYLSRMDPFEVQQQAAAVGAHRTVVFTSAWQQGSTYPLLGVDKDRVTAIIPEALTPVEGGNKAGGPRVVWHGDPTDGTPVFLAAVFAGIKNQVGRDWDDVSLLVSLTKRDPDSEKRITRQAASCRGVELATEMAAANVDDALRGAHVFADPSMSWRSQPMEAIRAASAGCLVVAPKHSGYVEALGDHGFLTPHVFDTALYGMAFAAVLHEAVGMARNAEMYQALAVAQKGAVDYRFNPMRIEAAWRELDGLLELRSKSP